MGTNVLREMVLDLQQKNSLNNIIYQPTLYMGHTSSFRENLEGVALMLKTLSYSKPSLGDDNFLNVSEDINTTVINVSQLQFYCRQKMGYNFYIDYSFFMEGRV